MSSGSKANSTGSRFEKRIAAELEAAGYIEVPASAYLRLRNSDFLPSKCFVRHIYVGETVFGTERFADFLIVNKEIFPDGLILECKWQQAGGSVDEKFSFLHQNILKTGVPTIFLYGGGGHKPGSIVYLNERIDGCNLLAVWREDEFYIEVNNGFFGTGKYTPTAKKDDDSFLYANGGLWEMKA
jgi:hypothetical protein